MADTQRGDDSADLVGRVVEEYFQRLRRGERPQLEEFVAQYPEIGHLLRTVIPGLQAAGQSPDVAADSVSALGSLGDFNILREVGRGGMGIVYEAEQVSLGRRVALKVLLHQASANRKQRRRFRREARAAARLHHTNIVPVFGVGEEGDVDYYVMQLIDGRGLDKVLDELRQVRGLCPTRQRPGGDAPTAPLDIPAMSCITQSLLAGELCRAPRRSVGEFSHRHGQSGSTQVSGSSSARSSGALSLSGSGLSRADSKSSSGSSRNTNYWDSVAQIGLQVAGALRYAHDHAILHRDIKPSNLILDGSGTVWVTDFGLARALDQPGLTNTGDILGTLRYMPPEALRGKTDQRGDLYSLGITIYEMLALRPAYDEADRHRLLAQVAEGSLQRLEHIDPSIPRDLVTIVHKAVECEPAHRYQHAAELRDDFARFLADEPIKARRISPIERVARWSQRNRGVAAALAAVAALLVLGTVASLMFAVYSSKLKDEAEYGHYVANILATHARTETGNRSTIHARKGLAATPAKYRNWEWAFLANRVWQPRTRAAQLNVRERKGTTAEFWQRGVPYVEDEFVPHSAMGTGMFAGKFNSEGTALVLVSANGSAELYSLATKELLADFTQPASMLFDVTSSPDDTKLVTSIITGQAIIYDVATGAPIVKSPEDYAIPQATWTWSPDQAHVISLYPDATIQIWDATTLDPRTVVTLRESEPESGFLETTDIRFSGDELWSAAIDGTICKWSFPKGELLDTIKAPAIEGMIHHAMSPDGKAAVAVFEDGPSFLWEINWEVATKDCRPLGVRKQPMTFMRGALAAFSPDGTCVAVMNDLLTATIHDVASGRRLCEIPGHSAEVKSLQFSHDGKGLLTVSEDGTAKIWTSRPAPPRGVPTFTNAHSDLIFQIDCDRYGKRLLSGSFDGTARVWDLQSRRLIATYQDHGAPIVAVDFNADGTRAASLDADGVLHVWDPATGNQIFHIDPQSDRFARHIRASGRIKGDMLYFPGVLSTGLFTPDGAHVVTFQKEAMKVFRADDGTCETSLADSTDHGWPVFSHDSTLVAILEMYARHPRVWDLRTGQLVGPQSLAGRHPRSLSMVAFSPVDDKIVSGDVGGSVILRHARTGELLHPPWNPKFGMVGGCRFSGDGQFVLIAYANGFCQVRDANSGEVVTTLAGHLGEARDVRLSPDGTRLLSWSTDDDAIVWDLARPAANQLVVLSGESRLIQAHWSPDGRDIITAWSNGSIRLWSGATKKDLASLVSRAGDFEEALDTWREQLTPAQEGSHD